MEKISILIVFLLWLCCFGAQGRECNFDFYFKPGQGCVKCPACPPGKELAKHCGHNNAGDKIGQSCSSCRAGSTYNDKQGGGCRVCQSCKEIEIKACTVTSNTVCGCPKGMYLSTDGDCKKCSYCCGENWERNTKNIVDTCKAQGLGRCICKRTWYCSGNCSSPTTASITTRTAPTTTPITTRRTTTIVTTTTTSPRSKETKHSSGEIRTTQVIFTTPELGIDDPEEQRGDKPVYPSLKPGWIVLICLGGVLVGSLAVMWCHKQTRKQISSLCCRNYAVLSTDGETLVQSHHEGHYEEHATRNLENNATPIPPGEEPVPPIFYSGITAEVYCSCRTRETDVEQIQCACTMGTSETIEKLPHNSSSTETISEEQDSVRKSSTCRISPSTSSSSRLSSPRTSECYCIKPSSSSSCVTASSSRGPSPEHYGGTSSSNSTFVTLSPPRERSPEHDRMSSSLNSTCTTPSPPRGRSPVHRCVTPSPCVTPISSRGQSPDPSSFRSVQSYSSQFSEDQEICNQSSEYTQSNDPVPISVEAHDKEHDPDATRSTRKNTSSAPGKRKQSRSVMGRNSPSAEKGVPCVPKMKENLPPKQSGDTDKDVTQIPNSDRGPGYNVTTTKGNDMNLANIADPCKYKKIHRNGDTEHRCTECCPQPEDSFFPLINRDRTCLKEEICKELNKCNSYKELARFARVDSGMEEYETSLNPAERVLDRIKASKPSLKLKEFEEMLCHLGNKRLDIVKLIQDHHIFCTFCHRNRFDSNA